MISPWQLRLDAARSESEVVRIAREFVAEMGADAVAGLGEDLQPGLCADATQIASYAFTLAMHRLQGAGAPLAKETEELVAFFTSAAMRLAQLTARSPDREP